MPIQFDSIPPEIVTKKNWVMWRWEKRNGKFTKPPYQPNGKPAKSNDPTTWATYIEACGAYKTGKFDGIGFMLGGDYTGIDSDGIRNPETGEIVPEHYCRIESLDSYTEISPSQKGVKTLLKGKPIAQLKLAISTDSCPLGVFLKKFT